MRRNSDGRTSKFCIPLARPHIVAHKYAPPHVLTTTLTMSLARISVRAIRASTPARSVFVAQRRWNSEAAAPTNPKIATIVDQISTLTLLETADLVASLKVRFFVLWCYGEGDMRSQWARLRWSEIQGLGTPAWAGLSDSQRGTNSICIRTILTIPSDPSQHSRHANGRFRLRSSRPSRRPSRRRSRTSPAREDPVQPEARVVRGWQQAKDHQGDQEHAWIVFG